MIPRALLALAERGYVFPKLNALTINRTFSPQTFPVVRVRVTRPHYQLRRLLEAGDVVTIAEPDALDAITLARAEFA